MKPWKSSFTVPIYPAHVYVVVTDDPSKADDVLPYRIADDAKEKIEGCEAMYSACQPDYAIVFKHQPDDNTIAHEIGHICRRIMRDIGWKIDADNDEPLAYLEGWMTEKVKKVLKKAPKK